ncbi:MAG: bifunctional DNA-binding transcriptional regulator/O6-methylguanine-DNA methyltransferase Ada [Candidatus Melainabacteria bacterium HGW-Melainabacteria-1]|nr:MAG: bifunctional DNA-binding transcriptional regulator/O6-methylguanine-DNA methyltransferase Ada [Candidatus Melainabacteria bacterium HGW-Melainabacteria-1]
MLSEDQMWTAIQAKDQALDGQFYYGVISTGIFCRPSCPARLPLRRNIRYFATPEQALSAGLRACKRCGPMTNSDPALEQFQAICRQIAEHCEESLPLAELAALAGLSPSHFQRRFKALIGVSPKQYQESCRFGQIKAQLRQGRDVTAAVYDAGFGSGSRLYEKLDTRLGMTPTQYRNGGKGLAIAYAGADTCVGRLMMAATDRGLCFVEFGADDETLLAQLRREYPQADLKPMDPAGMHLLKGWVAALDARLQGDTRSLELPLDIQGTAFQRKVWNYLQQIPYGEVQSYTEVAAGIGQPKAARAVASACAANKLAILIPCHRVIRGSGELGGYRWGLDLKRSLLDLERKQSRVATQ